jgi:hypothetical protein
MRLMHISARVNPRSVTLVFARYQPLQPQTGIKPEHNHQ